MKKALIVALACVNVVLLAALILGPAAGRAQAQAVRGAPDYLLVTGKVGADWDAVYLIDLARRQLLGLRWDRTRRQMLPIRGRSFTTDFDRPKQQQP